MSASAEACCIDCRWLETRVSFDRDAHYECRKTELPPGAAIAWRAPCAQFEPAPLRRI